MSLNDELYSEPLEKLDEKSIIKKLQKINNTYQPHISNQPVVCSEEKVDSFQDYETKNDQSDSKYNSLMEFGILMRGLRDSRGSEGHWYPRYPSELDFKMMLGIISQIGIDNFEPMMNEMIDVKTPLTQKSYNEIPTVTYGTVKHENTGSNNCSICLENFNDDDVVKRTNCKHFFHPECISKWVLKMKHTCPICRTSLGDHESHT